MSDPEEKAEEPVADPLAGWIEPGDKGATVLRLEEPVEIRGGTTVTRLVISRIKAKHMRGVRDETLDSKLGVLEAVSSETRAVIDNLAVADMLRALEVVSRGFPSGPPSGGAN